MVRRDGNAVSSAFRAPLFDLSNAQIKDWAQRGTMPPLSATEPHIPPHYIDRDT